MVKYNFPAIMSLQLVAMATLIASATAAREEEASSSKYAMWAEQNEVKDYRKISSSAEQIKSPSSESESEKHNQESCPAPSSEQEKAKTTTNFRQKWSEEDMENMSDEQMREMAASLMAEKYAENDVPIASHNHPHHACWQKCAFDKVRPYCLHLLIQSTIQGCLLTGGKACELYCTGGKLN